MRKRLRDWFFSDRNWQLLDGNSFPQAKSINVTLLCKCAIDAISNEAQSLLRRKTARGPTFLGASSTSRGSRSRKEGALFTTPSAVCDWHPSDRSLCNCRFRESAPEFPVIAPSSTPAASASSTASPAPTSARPAPRTGPGSPTRLARGTSGWQRTFHCQANT